MLKTGVISIAHLRLATRIAHLRIALHVSNPDVGNPMRWDDTFDTIESFQRCGSFPHVWIRGRDTQHMCGSAEVTDGCWGQTSHLHILLPSCWWLMVGLIYSHTILRQISFKPLKRWVCQNLNVQGHRARFHWWLLQSSSVKARLDLLITDDFAQTDHIVTHVSITMIMVDIYGERSQLWANRLHCHTFVIWTDHIIV